MAITKTMKIDYKLKDVTFESGQLIDENGEVIDLADELNKVFGDKTFTLTASFQNKFEHNISDFK